MSASPTPPPTPLPIAVRRTLETAVIGGAGALALHLLNVPAGPVLGALGATAVAALAGRHLGWSRPVTTVIFLIMGFAAGSTVTPATLHAAALWPLSILALLVVTAVTWGSGWLVFRRMTGAPSKTAFYASAPGALSVVMALAEADEADVPRIAVAQSLRLLVLVGSAPFVLSMGHAIPILPGPPAALNGLAAWIPAVIAALGGWKVAVRFKWPAPVFLGAFVGSAVLHAPGWVDVRPSPGILAVATAALGALIGSRFSGVRLRDLVRFMPASLCQIVVMVAVSVPVGWVVGVLAGVGPAAGMMAFAPGSMEVMTAIALTLNAHPAYVVAHHLVRSLLIMGLAPILATRVPAAPTRGSR